MDPKILPLWLKKGDKDSIEVRFGDGRELVVNSNVLWRSKFVQRALGPEPASPGTTPFIVVPPRLVIKRQSTLVILTPEALPFPLDVNDSITSAHHAKFHLTAHYLSDTLTKNAMVSSI